ncbi:MAG: Na+/H+ antiporter NhaC family protein [Saprospiraceae bacterium]
MPKSSIAFLFNLWFFAIFSFAQAEQLAPAIDDFKLVSNQEEIYLVADGLQGTALFEVNKKIQSFQFEEGKARLPLIADFSGKLVLLQKETGAYQLYHIAKLEKGGYRIKYIPLWLSILPPLIAILFALLTKEVVISLFLGLWSGSFIASGLRIDSIYYSLQSLLKVVDYYMISALANTGNLSVIVFSLLIGGMVALITRNGGMSGIVNWLSNYAKSARSAQLTTWLLGMVIFFDGYANMFIIGNTMRAITDKFKVSREKLAYIVDSTTAPVSAIAFISTWIGAELGYIDSGLQSLIGYTGEGNAYTFFLQSLQYSFYPFLTLLFIFMLIYSKRDFGAMYEVEHKNRLSKSVSATLANKNRTIESTLKPIEGIKVKWYQAVVPVIILISMTIFGLVDTGLQNIYQEMIALNIPVAAPTWSVIFAQMTALPGQDGGFFLKIGKILGQADSYAAMLWASFSSLLVAMIMTVWAKIMTATETVNTIILGLKMILPGLLILVFSWALATTIGELHTATYLSTSLEDIVYPKLMPVLVFILAATIAFSTGSSWGVMAILYPIVIPMTWAMCQAAGMDLEISQGLLAHVISVVLAAAVFGDHCSPISDTTILSSIVCGCDHIEHVRTQLPYALTVGGVSLFLCALSSLLNGGWVLNLFLLLFGISILGSIIWKFGKENQEII